MEPKTTRYVLAPCQHLPSICRHSRIADVITANCIKPGNLLARAGIHQDDLGPGIDDQCVSARIEANSGSCMIAHLPARPRIPHLLPEVKPLEAAEVVASTLRSEPISESLAIQPGCPDSGCPGFRQYPGRSRARRLPHPAAVVARSSILRSPLSPEGNLLRSVSVAVA